MTEADFEIDFYGDAATEQQPQQNNVKEGQDDSQDQGDDYAKGTPASEHGGQTHETEDVASVQGTKRKSEEDDRPVDAGATQAVMMSELNWWTTDDDIRGWLKKADCEGEVKDLTFSEHKVNGKSKG